jgi:DNA-binding transcriptional regulator YiaG
LLFKNQVDSAWCAVNCAEKISLDYIAQLYYIPLMREWKPSDIEDFRKAYRITRRALGELLGVTVSYVYQMERGLRTPSKTLQILLSRVANDFEKKGR